MCLKSKGSSQEVTVCLVGGKKLFNPLFSAHHARLESHTSYNCQLKANYLSFL